MQVLIVSWSESERDMEVNLKLLTAILVIHTNASMTATVARVVHAGHMP